MGQKKNILETVISIKIKNNVWYTWEGTQYIGFEEEPRLFFKGRYNQNNGVTQNTIKKEWDALYRLGIQNWK